MSVLVEIDGANDPSFRAAMRRLLRIPSLLDQAAEVALEQFGEALVERIQTLISTPYPPASSPGEAPHKRTGDLIESYEWRLVKGLLGGKTLEVGSNIEYAGWLELGTSKMAPRPHFRNSVDEELPGFAKLWPSQSRPT